MKIKRLYINNYKSLVDFELIEPNPFSVFVGPNAAGKSNIFEALEFLSYEIKSAFLAHDLFGGPSDFSNKKLQTKNKRSKGSLNVDFTLELNSEIIGRYLTCIFHKEKWIKGSVTLSKEGRLVESEADEKEKDKLLRSIEEQFNQSFSRLFVKNTDLVKLKTNGSDKLRIDANNLEPVLHRILQDKIKREEISDWLKMLIPELKKIEVVKSELSGDYFLQVFEKHLAEPISKNLISDGTYNILALLSAVYQSDEPQFLCIEEPENGLNPYAIRELTGFFRQMCEEKGHYIWLNTHSPTIVKELQPKELILINKENGITKAKQLDKDLKFKSMPLDEAWLTNTLGGGLPW